MIKNPTYAPPQITHTGAAFLPAHKMTKFCIYSKRPLLLPKKAVSTTKDRNFGVLPPTILYFLYWGVPPGKSSSSDFCQYYPPLFC